MKAWRVSRVEAFRQWEANDESDWNDSKRMLATLRDEDEETDRMRAGKAFHLALELGQSGDMICADGYTFPIRADISIDLPEVRELRAEKVYIVDDQPILITGQVDGIDGLRIDDHKTTGRFDAERYLQSYQWRLYLDIFAASKFRWNVFEIGETNDPMVWEVFGAHRLEQYRYPALGDDCQALVTRFARFVRAHCE